MGVEIERKFLVRDGWLPAGEGVEIAQGYLTGAGEPTVRVRLKGDAAYLTIKGLPTGISRAEFEYPIPVADAKELLATLASRRMIGKRRHLVEYAGHTWEVDVFDGDNAGLVVAEIELSHPDEKFALPPWAAEEVSGDFRYSNRYLATRPYRTWPAKAD